MTIHFEDPRSYTTWEDPSKTVNTLGVIGAVGVGLALISSGLKEGLTPFQRTERMVAGIAVATLAHLVPDPRFITRKN